MEAQELKAKIFDILKSQEELQGQYNELGKQKNELLKQLKEEEDK